MERKKQKLTDVCTIQYGYAFDSKKFSDDSENIALIRIRDVKSGVSNTYYTGEYDKSYLVKEGEILVGMDGEFNIAKWKSDPALLNQRVCKISGKDNIVEDYLQYYLSLELKNIERRTSFVTVKHLSAKELNALTLEIHTYEEQKKIANQLKLTESIIEKRKQQLSDLDNLIKSRFVEMFGDTLKNDKNFPTMEGKDLFKISNGKAVPNGKRFDEGIPAYGGNGISWYTDEVLFEGDTIVIGRVGFQSGNVHLAKGPLWITDNAMYISDLYGGDLSLVFLCEMMEQIDFTRYQDAGDLKKVTQKPFIEMRYILPPMPLQSEYVCLVEQVDKLKVEVKKSLDETQFLFDSLMQEYFE